MADVVSNLLFITGSSKNVSEERGTDGKKTKNLDHHTNPKICKSCGSGQHDLDQCQVFKKADVKERWKIATKIKCCYCCLSKHTGQCPNRKMCGVNNCPKYHHHMLHKPDDNQQKTEVTTCSQLTSNGVILKMLTVHLQGPDKVIRVTALLDEGSKGSLMDAHLAKSLGLQGPISQLCCKWTGGIYRFDPESQLIQAKIAEKNCGKFIDLKNVRTVKDLDLPGLHLDVDDLIKRYPYIKQGDTAAVKDGKPLILIGQNNGHLIVSRQVIQPLQNAPLLSKTLIGWVIHGPTNSTNMSNSPERIFTCCETDYSRLHDEVKSYFTVENFGVTTNKGKHRSSEDERALKIEMNRLEKQKKNKKSVFHGNLTPQYLLEVEKWQHRD